MLKQFICQYTELELVELIKQAIRAVNAEQSSVIHTANSPPLIDSTTSLSSKEVCALLGISAPTLIKYRQAQKIRGKKICGKYFYLYSEIQKMLSPSKTDK